MTLRRRALSVGSFVVLMLTACGCSSSSSGQRPAGVVADPRVACIQASLDALTLSGRIGAAAYAHRATPSELAEVDAAIAALRREVAGLAVNARDRLSGLIEAATKARRALATGQTPDASGVLRAQQQFASSCTA